MSSYTTLPEAASSEENCTEENCKEDITENSNNNCFSSSLLDNIIYKAFAIDIHTHLFPPQFENLFSFGIDELLTYHYLVAEYFSHPVDITPSDFYSLSKQYQAERVWKTLFVDNSPISEACQGILTILNTLKLNVEFQNSSLDIIRKWFDEQDNKDMYVDLIFLLSNISYVYMTNNPFDKNETIYWKNNVPYNKNKFKTCIRVDELFYPDKLFALRYHINNNFTVPYEFSQQECTSLNLIYLNDFAEDDIVLSMETFWDNWNNGSNVENYYKYLTAYLCEWYEILTPEYIMMSLPHDFSLSNEYQRKVMEDIILPFARAHSLPIFLKIGADRQVNPELKLAGDGVGISDLSWLGYLCKNYSDLKFVATVLSVNNQHQITVLARKFCNLHIYGCWWFCNTPSIIKTVTNMRLELLGTSFTYQHSDSRVLEHLLYKWSHSKQLLYDVLNEKYSNMNYPFKKEHIENDIKGLLGENYLKYINKPSH